MLISAYVMPHPPLAVPAVGGDRLSQIKATTEACLEVAAEIAELKPETIIVVTPHSMVYSDYFHISPGLNARGDFSRFGAAGVKIETAYDAALAGEIASCAAELGVYAGELGERDPSLDHGVMVPLFFVNQSYADYKLLRISQSGMEPALHYRLGQAIVAATEKCGRRALLIASADLSHKLSATGPYAYAAEGAVYDELVVLTLGCGDFLGLFTIPEATREKAGECGHNSLMVLAGCFDQQQVESRLLSYEGPFGVGYAVAAFKPGEVDVSRDFLRQSEEVYMAEAAKMRQSEDEYQGLARLALEHALAQGKGAAFQPPSDLPPEMTKERAGVFVSLHKNGRLRGCIGTTAATTNNIAWEIAQNAVSAGLRDSRFDPVSADELPFLSYKVDVLAEAEAIPDATYLDVKRYGVIVSSGARRGLLLPNLEGIDTTEQQISIARQKAGIPEGVTIELERFEVVRHG